MTPAHVQSVVNRYQISYPDHQPRATDPHYKAFNTYRARHVDAAVCFVGRHVGFDQCADALGGSMLTQPALHGHGLELHHKVIEFSLLNSVDLKALAEDYPFLIDSAAVDAWSEGEGNLEFICAAPDSLVTMPDGQRRLITEVRVGDSVVGHDGESHAVTAVARRHHSGPVIVLDGVSLTPNHLVLTPGGWRAAGEMLAGDYVWMPDAEVFALRRAQDEILGSVVRTVTIEMVDAFTGFEVTTEAPLHDTSVFHAGRRPQIALAGERRRDSSSIPAPTFVESLIESLQPAGVAAEVRGPDVGPEQAKWLLARPTRRHHCAAAATLPPSGSARRAAGGVVAEEVEWRQERATADGARSKAETRPPAHGRWHSLGQVRRITYAGDVHDLSIANSHSYLLSGMAVHNCAKHHRGVGGIHHAAYADFEASLYIRSLISAATASH